MTAYKVTRLLMDGCRKMAMGLPLWSHRIFVVLGIFLLATACQPMDAEPDTDLGKVEFALDIKGGQSSLKSAFTKAMNQSNASAVVVSIKDSAGNVVYGFKQIQLYDFATNQNYQSAPLSLLPGTYELTEFRVIAATGQTLYAAPMESSPLAYLVGDPLNISFTVAKDAVTKVRPEVLSTEERTPEDFGYVNFGFEVVKVLDFLVAVFAYDETSQSLVMTTAHLQVASESGQTVYAGDLQALTNKVTMPDRHAQYQVTITKPNYVTYVQTFSGTQLAEYFNSSEEGPLEVVLERIPYLSSCKEILEAGRSNGDGMYTIDPDGTSGPIAPLDVYCDMTTDGGGWTAVDPQTASTLKGKATMMHTTDNDPSCKVVNGLFEAAHSSGIFQTVKLICNYDITLGFTFSDIGVRQNAAERLQFLNLFDPIEIAGYLAAWESYPSDSLKSDIRIGSSTESAPSLSLGQALGDGTHTYGQDTTIELAVDQKVTTATPGQVLRIQYAGGSGSGQKEGMGWKSGRIFVR